MARSSLTNSPAKLYLSRRQINLFQKIILVGNQMSKALGCQGDAAISSAKNGAKLSKRWDNLMVQLVKLLH
jgi:hypothetical protein